MRFLFKLKGPRESRKAVTDPPPSACSPNPQLTEVKEVADGVKWQMGLAPSSAPKFVSQTFHGYVCLLVICISSWEAIEEKTPTWVSLCIDYDKEYHN